MNDQPTEHNIKLASGRVARTNAPAGMSDDELRRQVRGVEKQYFGREEIDRMSGWKLGVAVGGALLLVAWVVYLVVKVFVQ